MYQPCKEWSAECALTMELFGPLSSKLESWHYVWTFKISHPRSVFDVILSWMKRYCQEDDLEGHSKNGRGMEIVLKMEERE